MTGRSASLSQRVARALRLLGPLDGSLYMTDRVLAQLSRGRIRLVKYRLVAQPLLAEPAIRVRASSGTNTEPASSGHPSTAHFPRPAHVIATRYASGAKCLVASVKGEFAGYLWWQRQHYDEDEVRCRFLLEQPDISAWDFDVYVEPRYRLGRVLALLWQDASLRMRAEGVRWSFSRISAFNAESLASHARLGAALRATALFIVIGPIQISLFNCRPFIHLSIHTGSRPLLRLSPPPAA